MDYLIYFNSKIRTIVKVNRNKYNDPLSALYSASREHLL